MKHVLIETTPFDKMTLRDDLDCEYDLWCAHAFADLPDGEFISTIATVPFDPFVHQDDPVPGVILKSAMAYVARILRINGYTPVVHFKQQDAH
jgi:hypothetical protein